MAESVDSVWSAPASCDRSLPANCTGTATAWVVGTAAASIPVITVPVAEPAAAADWTFPRFADELPGPSLELVRLGFAATVAAFTTARPVSGSEACASVCPACCAEGSGAPAPPGRAEVLRIPCIEDARALSEMDCFRNAAGFTAPFSPSASTSACQRDLKLSVPDTSEVEADAAPWLVIASGNPLPPVMWGALVPISIAAATVMSEVEADGVPK